ncbi:MAG: hypothetical protein VX589_15340 [Myxococcota bacterium]|nr:hypothetical protein [Myxococcota bacterium]
MKPKSASRDAAGRLVVAVDRGTAILLDGSSRVAFPSEKDREVGVTRPQMMSEVASQGLQSLPFDGPGALTFVALSTLLTTRGPRYAAGLFGNGQAHAITLTGVLSVPCPRLSSPPPSPALCPEAMVKPTG